MSFGREEARSPRSGADLELRNSVLVKENSSDLPEYVRVTPTIISGVRGYGALKLNERIRTSADVYGAVILIEETETSQGPKTSASAQGIAYGGRFGVSLATDNDLEVGAAAEIRAKGESTLDRDNATLKSKTKTAAHLLWRPGFVLKKRSDRWTAGAFYELGDDEKVKITATVLDDQRETETYATLPPRFGAFFDLSIGTNMSIGTELSFIRGSSSSLRAGTSEVFDDSYRTSFHIRFGERDRDSIWISLSHESLSYADQDYIAFENIPVTEAEVTWTTTTGWYLGALLTYSSDKQSTEEINRNFLIYGLGLRTGLKMPNL
jgi:hypothetical protein